MNSQCSPMSRPGMGMPPAAVGLKESLCFVRGDGKDKCVAPECGTLTYDRDAAGTIVNKVLTDESGAPVPEPFTPKPCPPWVKVANAIGGGGPPPPPLDIAALAKAIFDATAPVRTACLTCR